MRIVNWISLLPMQQHVLLLLVLNIPWLHPWQQCVVPAVIQLQIDVLPGVGLLALRRWNWLLPLWQQRPRLINVVQIEIPSVLWFQNVSFPWLLPIEHWPWIVFPPG